MVLFYKKLYKFKTLKEIPMNLKKRNWKKNLIRFNTFFYWIWIFAPPDLNMRGSSRFVSCPIALRFWVKLQSPICYIYIFIIWELITLINLAVMTKRHEKLLFLLFGRSSAVRKCFSDSLREKCPNKEFFLVRIFSYSDWIQRFTE